MSSSKINWDRPLTENEAAFKDLLVANLPPVIARHDVDKFTGGWLSPKTLRNDDSKMVGPRSHFKSGKKILYRSAELVEYGIRRFGVIEKEILL